MWASVASWRQIGKQNLVEGVGRREGGFGNGLEWLVGGFRDGFWTIFNFCCQKEAF